MWDRIDRHEFALVELAPDSLSLQPAFRSLESSAVSPSIEIEHRGYSMVYLRRLPIALLSFRLKGEILRFLSFVRNNGNADHGHAKYGIRLFTAGNGECELVSSDLKVQESLLNRQESSDFSRRS